MAKWRFDRTASYDYPTLGFRAAPTNILTSTFAPDAWWTSVTDTGQAETITRYSTPSQGSTYTEPVNRAVYIYDDASNEWKASDTSLEDIYDETVSLLLDDSDSLTRVALNDTVSSTLATTSDAFTATHVANAVSATRVALNAGFARKDSGPTVVVTSHGATGDGVTDDTTAITAALAALPASGGTVHFPRGVYLAANLRAAKSNFTWTMDAGASIKKNANGPVLSWGLGGQTKAEFLGLRIDGNGATFTGPGLVIDGGTSPRVTGGEIVNTASNPLQFTGDGFGHSARVSDMILFAYDALLGGSNATVAAISLPLDSTTAPNRQFSNLQTSGTLLFTDAGSQDSKFSMCTARNIAFTGTPGKMFLSVVRLASIGTTITLRGVQSTWTGCALAGNVEVDGTSSLSSLSGNVIAGTLTINAGAARTAVGSNTLSTTGGFVDLGTQTQVFLDAGAGAGPSTMPPQLLSGIQVFSANTAVYMRVSGRGYVSKIGMHVNAQSGNLCVGVYDSNGSPGTSARPGARKATSGSIACPAAGYGEIALTAPVYVNEGDWIAIVSDNATASLRTGGAQGFTTTLANGLTHHQFGAWPLPATAAASGNAAWSFILTGVV